MKTLKTKRYNYLKYKDRITNKISEGYYSQEKTDKIFEEFAPAGFKRNIIRDYIGDFDYKTVEELRNKLKEITGRKPRLIE